MCQKIYYMKLRHNQQNVKYMNGEDVSENILHEITAQPAKC